MADGTIKIDITVDGKQVQVASKDLDNLGKSGQDSGKGIKTAEDSMDGLSDSSAKVGKDVKGASDSLDSLGDSGSKASKDLKGTDGAIDGLADSSAEASKNVKGTADGLDGMSDSANEAASSAKKAGEETAVVGEEAEKASNNTKKFAVSLGLIAVASAAFVVLKSSLDDAITRFDTLNKFPKVLQALGVSAEDAERSMQRLSDGTDGLPTKLDEIASTAQRMYTSFGDMDLATESALGLNNALLSQGSSAGEAKRGTDMYLKALQTGQMDMVTWRTLSETMDVGLIKIAEGFGYAGDSVKDDLYKALQSGSITMDMFNAKLVEVGTGTGELASLAKTNSQGLATSFQNIQTSVSRGLANVIQAFDKLSNEVTGNSIAQNIDKAKVVVNAAFKVIVRVIEGATPVVKLFAGAVKAAIPVVDALSPAIVGLFAAYAAYTVISKAQAAFSAATAAINLAQTATKSLTLLTSAQVTAQMLSTGATQADVVAKAAQAGTISLATFAIGVMTGAISASTAVQIIGTAASYAFGVAIRFLMGPVGWIIAAIGLLVTGVIALVKWFNKSTAEGEKLNEETEKLTDSVSELNDSVGGSAKAYKDQQTQSAASARTNVDLAKKVEDLAKKENKSAAEKMLLKDNIDQLNESVTGLNVSYDEEANALSMSSEQIAARVDLMEQQTSYNDAFERQIELTNEQHQADLKIEEINTLMEEANQLYEDGDIKKKEYKNTVKKLEESEAELMVTTGELAVEQKKTEEQITESSAAITAAIESGAAGQIIAFEDLSEAQQKTVEDMKATWEDYKDAATDMFDQLSEKSTMSVAEMQTNLDKNQEVIGNWATNIATLTERGVDEGLLETLRDAGPESAGHVNALVNASDAELEKLSTTFANGGDVATDALSKSLGIQESGVMAAVGDLVTDTEQALSAQIQSADFVGLGIDIAKGQAKGINDGTPEAERAAKDMAQATEDAAREQSETRSPSRVFERIGKDSADGLVLGFKNGTSAVINSAKQLSMATINQYKSMPASFRGIGINAMSGLNSGLHAGSGRVMSTARNLANRVAATMRSALKIHSPSRLFRDDIGKMIPEGIAVGIEANESSVFDALKNTASQMLDFARPEQAIGALAFSGDASGGGSDVYNNSNAASTTNYFTINYQGSGDAEDDAEHIADLVDKEFAKRKGFNNYFKGGK